MSKVAIIVGSSGQDGTLLTEKLKHLEYCVIGVGRGDIDISNADEVEKLIIESQPDEVYYLAAHHHSSEVYINNETELFKKSMDVQANAVVNFLDAIYRCKNKGNIKTSLISNIKALIFLKLIKIIYIK